MSTARVSEPTNTRLLVKRIDVRWVILFGPHLRHNVLHTARERCSNLQRHYSMLILALKHYKGRCRHSIYELLTVTENWILLPVFILDIRGASHLYQDFDRIVIDHTRMETDLVNRSRNDCIANGFWAVPMYFAHAYKLGSVRLSDTTAIYIYEWVKVPLEVRVPILSWRRWLQASSIGVNKVSREARHPPRTTKEKSTYTHLTTVSYHHRQQSFKVGIRALLMPFLETY